MRFAAMAAAYVRAFIARPGGAWYLDQIALFASYAHLQRRGVGFAAIPVNWYALFGACGEAVADSTVFWSVTANIVANADALSTRLFRVHLPVAVPP